jgi:hypothetical protein
MDSIFLHLACIIHKPKFRQKIDAFGNGEQKIVFGEVDMAAGFPA